jgi:hypothetical protein
LSPRPASLRDHAWHTNTSDDAIAKVIVEGGPAIDKHATMPPSLDLKDDRTMTNALVHLVRSFEDKPPAPTPGE